MQSGNQHQSLIAPLLAAGIVTHHVIMRIDNEVPDGRAEELALSALCQHADGPVYRLEAGSYALSTAVDVNALKAGLRQSMAQDGEAFLCEVVTLNGTLIKENQFDRRAISILASTVDQASAWPTTQAIIDANYAIQVARLTAEGLEQGQTTAIAALEVKLDLMEDRLAGLSSQLAEFRKEATQDTSLNAINSALQSLDARVKSLSYDHAAYNGAASNRRDGPNFASESTTICRLTAAFGAILRRIDAQATEFEGRVASLTELNPVQQASATSQAENIDAQMRSLPDFSPEREGVARLSAALATILRRLDGQSNELEERIASLPTPPSSMVEERPVPRVLPDPDFASERQSVSRCAVALGSIMRRLDAQTSAIEDWMETLPSATVIETAITEASRTMPTEPVALQRLDLKQEREGLSRASTALVAILRRLDARASTLEATLDKEPARDAETLRALERIEAQLADRLEREDFVERVQAAIAEIIGRLEMRREADGRGP